MDARAPVRRVRNWLAPAAVVLVVVLLRLPSLSEPHHYGDEGVFAATAQHLLDGRMLYTDAWDNKPPLVFLVYAAMLKLFGPSMLALRLLGLVVVAVTALTALAIGRRIGGTAAGWMAGLFVAVLGSLPLIEATLLLTEALAALLAALAVLLTLRAVERTGRQRAAAIAAAGALRGLATLFKQVAVFDAAAVGLWLLLRPGRPLRDAAALSAGWCLPIAIVALWLAAAGALGAAWEALAGGYTTYLDEGSALPLAFTLLKPLPALIALGWALYQRRRAGAVQPPDLTLLWLGWALLGVLLAGRPFGHYLLQVVTPMAVVMADLTPRPPSLREKGVPTLGATLVFGASAHTQEHQQRSQAQGTPFPRREGGVGANATRVRSATLILSLTLILVAFQGFWLSHPTLTPAYYSNWFSWVSGEKSRAEYERFFTWRVRNQQELARLIDAGAGERTLFVWGEYPWLYPLADAHNPTRYSTSYQTSLAPGAKAEVIDTLRVNPPRYIAQELDEWRRLPGLTTLLDARYDAIARVDNTTLWRRRD